MLSKKLLSMFNRSSRYRAYKPHGVVSSECCSLWGRAQILDPGLVKFSISSMLIFGISCGCLQRRWIMTPLSQPNTLMARICQSRSERPSKTVAIPVFHVDYCLLRPYSCWEWDVRVASQWLISSDVQLESLYSVDHPPRPCMRPLFKQHQEVGMALFRSSLISFASCLWRSTGSVYSSLPSWLSFRSWH